MKGIYVSADTIRKELLGRGVLFSDYKIPLVRHEFEEFYHAHVLSEPLEKFMGAPYTIDARKKRIKLLVSDDFVATYFASIVADFIVKSMIARHVSIVYETVMSHPSKIQLMRDASAVGYRVYLYFFGTSDPYINVWRVQKRVEHGGHDVPREKIVARYYRSLDNLEGAVASTHRTFVFDTTSNDGSYTYLLETFRDDRGRIQNTFHAKQIPYWLYACYAQKHSGVSCETLLSQEGNKP
jgi:predicted ABC-type ATPase